MAPPMDAFFQPAPGGGQRLYLHHTPRAGQTPLGAVLYIHPWAEEMNKSRRMAALGSRALAAQGWAVLQVDLLGCGDSSGDFGDATWEAWLDDVTQAAQWLRARHPGAPQPYYFAPARRARPNCTDPWPRRSSGTRRAVAP